MGGLRRWRRTGRLLPVLTPVNDGARPARQGPCRWLSAAAVLLLATTTPVPAQETIPGARAVIIRDSLRVGDQTRTYLAYVPSSIVGRSSVPLILAFHGSNGTGAGLRQFSGLDALALSEDAVVVYPDATVGNWAEGCGCNIADRLEVNDTGFVALLIDTLAQRFAIDRDWVLAVGYSQGGLFVHRVACEMSDRFRAVATVAAPISAPLAEDCRPVGQLAILGVQGTVDQVFPWVGGGVGKMAFLGAEATMAGWRQRLGCDALPERVSHLGALKDGSRVWIDRGHNCVADSRVELVGVEGGGHGWDVHPEVVTVDLLRSFFFGDPTEE